MKKILGRYEVTATIGEGGMGVIWRAYDPPPLDREVAIKTLREFPNRTALELFYKECNVLKSIDHPNVIQILDIGVFKDDGATKPFFVMPLLRGQTLDEIIKTAPHRLSVARVVDIVSQTCRGLQHAHEHGLIHRDIKPSNLFILADDAVKIIDFGVVQVVDARTRTSSFSKGTLLYMSPEQVSKKPITPRSDIFSLGLVCYEALTKRHPFRGATEEEIVDAIRRVNPPPISGLNDGVSPLISRVVHKAMAKEPLNRFDSAKEFGDNLQRALHNLPIEIFDPSRIQPRIDRAKKALESGDFQFAGEIVSELEASGHIDDQILDLRSDIEKLERQRTIAQLLENAQTRYEEEEDPLALQKLHEILQIDPANMQALGLKRRIEERRSERQVDQWLRLAEQHIENHSYSHAREALKNVLALRPKESRALRLEKELQADEQEYVRLRRQKEDLFESARDAYANGEISQALSHMRLVLDLDHRAPDSSTPGTCPPYQGFYNKIHSEHEALNNGYVEARRHLSEQDFVGARQICDEFLARYPGQPLFHALKFDVEEQQRQRLSSYIADVNRRLDAEPDLDTKVSLLREAVGLYPDEPHFERLLALMQEKRDLVRTIVMRAESHEGRGQINEALSDFQTLENIYPAYPGLKYEVERLQKRRDQLARDATKAEWVRRVDRQLESGSYARALELLDSSDIDFANDSELIELRKLAEQAFANAQRAEKLLADGQRQWAEGAIDAGIATLREAQRLDERNPAVRATLRDALIDRARAVLDSDWNSAEPLIDEALGLDTQNTVAKSLRSQVSDRRRDETVAQCAALARRLQGEKELEKAEAELKRVLAIYPGDPRLTAVLDTIRKELGNASRKKARIEDIEELRDLRQRAEKADDSGELEAIFTQTQELTSRHVGDSNRDEIDTIGREIERIVQNRRGRPAGPGSDRGATPGVKPLDKTGLLGAAFRNKRIGWSVTAVTLTILIIASAVVAREYVRQRRPDSVPVIPTASIRVRTTPAGAVVKVDGQAQPQSDFQREFGPGEHVLEATLVGYAPLTKNITLSTGATSDVVLALEPIPDALRLTTPDAENGNVWIDDARSPLAGGTFAQDLGSPGGHVLRLRTPLIRQEATIGFTTAVGSMPVVTSLNAPQRQAVVISSLAGSARVMGTPTLGSVPVAMDGNPVGVLTPDGLTINDLGQTMHELTLGEGKDLRRMSFSVGPGPALEAIVYSDRDVGSLLISANESDASVQVDGRDYARQTADGRLLVPNLASGQHTILVRKEGFIDAEPQTIDVAKGQQATVHVELHAFPRLAHLGDPECAERPHRGTRQHELAAWDRQWRRADTRGPAWFARPAILPRRVRTKDCAEGLCGRCHCFDFGQRNRAQADSSDSGHQFARA